MDFEEAIDLKELRKVAKASNTNIEDLLVSMLKDTFDICIKYQKYWNELKRSVRNMHDETQDQTFMYVLHEMQEIEALNE